MQQEYLLGALQEPIQLTVPWKRVTPPFCHSYMLSTRQRLYGLPVISPHWKADSAWLSNFCHAYQQKDEELAILWAEAIFKQQRYEQAADIIATVQIEHQQAGDLGALERF